MADDPPDPPLSRVGGSYTRKQIPPDVQPRDHKDFRRVERLSGWPEAYRQARQWRADRGVNREAAESETRAWLADQGDKTRQAKHHVDIDVAFRRLFPWASAEIVVAPAAWGAAGAPRGDQSLADPYDLPMDWIVASMLDKKPNHGRLREDVESTGFADFFLAARAGVFRAVVAAAWKWELVEAQRKADGAIVRLEATGAQATRLAEAITALVGGIDVRDLIHLRRKSANLPDIALVRERQKELAQAFGHCAQGVDALYHVATLAAEAREQLDPPSDKAFTWAIAFAESLAETWRDLTGAPPGDRNPSFTAFVDAAYQTAAADKSGRKWSTIVRNALSAIRRRDGRNGFDRFAERLEAGGSAAQKIGDQHVWREMIEPHLRRTKPSWPIREQMLDAILTVEAARRMGRFRPFMESYLARRDGHSGDAS